MSLHGKQLREWLWSTEGPYPYYNIYVASWKMGKLPNLMQSVVCSFATTSQFLSKEAQFFLGSLSSWDWLVRTQWATTLSSGGMKPFSFPGHCPCSNCCVSCCLLQIMAKWWDEALLFRIGLKLEQFLVTTAKPAIYYDVLGWWDQLQPKPFLLSVVVLIVGERIGLF